MCKIAANPGGNHGSFFRISTHSVGMMAERRDSEEKYLGANRVDGLNFASTILSLAGMTAPMPDRVVQVQQK